MKTSKNSYELFEEMIVFNENQDGDKEFIEYLRMLTKVQVKKNEQKISVSHEERQKRLSA
jgi:hypothetical protein